ncbi:MAG: hypothetical protein JKY56_12885, partial [Kofleriaceae bacterium]|nr:hypothetical protein [Kofleriaceae bacterium]
SAEALNGTYTTPGCTAGEISKIDAAMSLIATRLLTDAYEQCLVDALINERLGVIVEGIVPMLSPQPTQITCTVFPPGNDADADSDVSPGPPSNNYPEYMSIDRSFLTTVSIAQLAGTIVHEATHSKGWGHPGNPDSVAYPWTVPVQAASCMVDLQPDGWMRSQPAGDTELSPVGGDGGQAFMLRCPGGEQANGIIIDSSSQYVNRFRLNCSDGSLTNRVGSYKDSTQTKTVQCDPGYSLTGFHGMSGSVVNGLIPGCQSNTDIANDSSGVDSLYWGGGSWSGTYTKRFCPLGMTVVGATGQAGARIDQVRWVCEDIDGTTLPIPHAYQLRGLRTGASKIGLCSGHGVVRALHGHMGGEVDRFGVECYPSTVTSNGLPFLMEGNARRHGQDSNGGIGGLPFSDSCPDGKAMIGLRFRSGSRIDAVGGVCAPMSTWAGGSWASHTDTPMRGGLGGSYSTIYCPQGEFLVGVNSWASYTSQHQATTIHGIEPICRKLHTASSSQ